jgi:hypothetical protein
MPSLTLISHTYQQPTSTLTVRGEAPGLPEAAEGSSTPPLRAIQQNFECQLEIRQGETTKTLQGDSVWLSDLIAVIDRYVGSQLSGAPKGTFSGTVAIRPLDFIFHRLTVRQGENQIAQVDLSMTQLYDLLENLSQVADDIPQLASLGTPVTRAWYRQPAGIAALLVGGIALVAGVGIWASRTPEKRAPTAFNSAQEQLTAPEASGDPLLRLQNTLAQQWQSPPDLQESLIYRVTVDAAGSLLAAEPENELARERRAETPLADLPELPPDPLPKGAKQFRISLGPESRVEVTQIEPL